MSELFVSIVTDLKPRAYLRYLKSEYHLDQEIEVSPGEMLEIKLPDEASISYLGEAPEKFEFDKETRILKVLMTTCILIIKYPRYDSDFQKDVLGIDVYKAAY